MSKETENKLKTELDKLDELAAKGVQILKKLSSCLEVWALIDFLARFDG
jgi:hypothetical protein